MQGLHQEFSDWGLALPTRGLKYGLQGTIVIRLFLGFIFSLISCR